MWPLETCLHNSDMLLSLPLPVVYCAARVGGWHDMVLFLQAAWMNGMQRVVGFILLGDSAVCLI